MYYKITYNLAQMRHVIFFTDSINVEIALRASKRCVVFHSIVPWYSILLFIHACPGAAGSDVSHMV